jgi:hypothetical protein
VTVSISDAVNCPTFGQSWEEAYVNLIDTLAACLSIPESTVHPRMSKKTLETAHPDAQIMPTPVDKKALCSYEKAECGGNLADLTIDDDCLNIEPNPKPRCYLNELFDRCNPIYYDDLTD